MRTIGLRGVGGCGAQYTAAATEDTLCCSVARFSFFSCERVVQRLSACRDVQRLIAAQDDKQDDDDTLFMILPS